MSSILTNSSALTALQNLSATQKSLQTTQNQISTGLKVGSSADNASYWSIASTMKSDNGALGAVKTSLAQSASMLSFTNSAINNVISVMNQIKNDLVTAKQPGADLEGDYESVFDRLRQTYGKGEMPRTVNMITGPSRSADIAQTMLLGAHGPRKLHIVIVDEA